MKKEKQKSPNLSMEKDAKLEKTEQKAEQKEHCEIDDDFLEGVSGGLVQLVNPSSSRL